MPGTQVAPRWHKVFQEESLLPFDLYPIPHPSSPAGDQLKSLHVSLHWYPGRPQKGPPIVDSKQQECGLSLLQRPEKLARNGKGKAPMGVPSRSLPPLPTSRGHGSWLVALYLHHPMPSPVTGIAAPGILLQFELHPYCICKDPVPKGGPVPRG